MSIQINKFYRMLARYVFYSARCVMKNMPYFIYRRSIYCVFIGCVYVFMGKRKKLVRKNIDFVYQDSLSESEKTLMARRCYQRTAKNIVDLVYLLDHPDEMCKRVRIEGLEHLDKVLKEQKGVVCLSAHLGMFLILYLRLSFEGYKPSIIMRHMHDQSLEQHIVNFGQSRGLNTIFTQPRGECMVKSLKALKDNGLLFILLDQHYGAKGGISVDFFGQKSVTATGPLVFKERANTVIMPIFIVSEDKEGYHKIIIEPPMDIEESKRDSHKIYNAVQNMSDKIEEYVRRYPYDWGGWFHRRWKHAQECTK